MKAEEIFNAALDRKSAAERQAYVDTACGDNTDLHAQVVGLLRSHDEAGSFLDAPLFDSPPTVDHWATSSVRQAARSDDIPLDFLSPSNAPDSLGRIDTMR